MRGICFLSLLMKETKAPNHLTFFVSIFGITGRWDMPLNRQSHIHVYVALTWSYFGIVFYYENIYAVCPAKVHQSNQAQQNAVCRLTEHFNLKGVRGMLGGTARRERRLRTVEFKLLKWWWYSWIVFALNWAYWNKTVLFRGVLWEVDWTKYCRLLWKTRFYLWK